MKRGRVQLEDGTCISATTRYLPGRTVLYEREVADEPDVPFDESIVYRDERILIADKPHFLPVVPAGPYVRQSLLYRLRERTGIDELTPVHRLDRDTAGLVLFVLGKEHRAAYHDLFAQHAVVREYEALAHVAEPISGTAWRVDNRMEPGTPWYVQRIVQGHPNATTRIELIEDFGAFAHFRLLPETGRKHQLRVHMATLGWPIVNDRIYGREVIGETDHDRPLQLIATRLAFEDPISGGRIEADSLHRLYVRLSPPGVTNKGGDPE